MHRALHLLGRRFQVSANDELRDQLGRVRSDDMGAQHLRVLLVTDDLDEPFRLPRRERSPIGDPREYAYLDVEALFPRGFLGEADRRHLRMTVGAVGNVVVVDPRVWVAMDRLDTRDPLVRALVRQ